MLLRLKAVQACEQLANQHLAVLRNLNQFSFVALISCTHAQIGLPDP